MQYWSGTRISARARLFLLQLAAVVVLVAVTNRGVPGYVIVLMHHGSWIGLATFFFMWALGISALVIVMLLPNLLLRGFWALMIAASAAAGFCFYLASQTDLSIFDAVTLWGARQDAGRASSFYQPSLLGGAAVFVAMFVLIVLPPPPMSERNKRLLRCLALAPAIPIVVYALLIATRNSYVSRALPVQFLPISIAAIVSIKAAANPIPERNPVAWRPGTGMAKHVVVLVDESVRGDFIDFRDGNPYTPEIARLQDRMVNFGPASSGGNCSNYSNAILRFGASRHDLTQSLLRNATLWRYAKVAGYRTVFIDAQARYVKTYGGKFQDFMSAQEAKDIDDFHALDSDRIPSLDDKLMDIVIENLRSDASVFIYAVKNGAHFPYDLNYPPEAAEFKPTMRVRGLFDPRARVNSYRNAVKWSVDRILSRLVDEADLKDTVVIYTSDHGQNLTGEGLTHCTVENPAPYEGLVPLLAITENPLLRSRFAAAAEESSGHASHFEIAPTILRLFGYARKDIATQYSASLFERDTEPAAFTNGDIFGLFSSTVRWHALDFGASTVGKAVPAGAQSVVAADKSDPAQLH